MITIEEVIYWNQRTYGKAIKIKNPIPKKHRLKAVIFCIVTPCTNWLIPFIFCNDVILRYDTRGKKNGIK